MMRTLVAAAFFSLVAASSATAQNIDGDWQGTIATPVAELRVVVHLVRDAAGGLTGTLDSPDQGVKGIPITSASLADSTLKFSVANVGGSFEGQVSAGTDGIAGTWSQAGVSFPLELTRPPSAAAAPKKTPKPSDIDGDWEGAVAGQLQVILHITTFEDGMTATLDSPSQKSFGAPVTSITRTGEKLQFEMRQFVGNFSGTLDASLTTITGTWTQMGNSLPLVLKRVQK